MTAATPGERRRRRLVWWLLGVMLLALVAGFVAALVMHHPGQHAASPRHPHERLWNILETVFSVAVVGVFIAMFRDQRAARRVGLPRQAAGACMGQADRAHLLRGARAGVPATDHPAAQWAVVRREYLRTRAGQVLFPLLTAQQFARLMNADDTVSRCLNGVLCVLMAFFSVHTSHQVGQLRRFLRAHPDGGRRTPPPTGGARSTTVGRGADRR